MPGQLPDENEIILDGVHFKLVSGLSVLNTASFQGKVTLGDYSLDSNDLLSAWVISDLTGGHGIADLVVATDQNRYRIGDIYTRYPKQWTKPFSVAATKDFGANAYYPLGDMYYAAGTTWYWYAASNTKLLRNHADPGATALTAAPVSKDAVPYTGTAAEARLFIPMGASGYAEYLRSTNTLTNHAADGTHPAAVSFALWDDKLICVDTAGQLWYSTAATSAFTSYGSTAKADPSYAPLHLVKYFNRNEEPTLMLVCDRAVFAFDAAGPKLWLTEIDLPPHPHAGAGVCVWRGDLYISAGMDIVTWNGSVQRNIGLSRDDGLPYASQGWITDLCPTLNSIYAPVHALTTTPGMTVHEWTGIGWHQIATFDGLTGYPTWMIASRAAATSTVVQTYWGTTTGYLYTQSIPIAFTNPREAVASGSYVFGVQPGTGLLTSGHAYNLQTGRFNAGMQGYRKIANAVEVDLTSNPEDVIGCGVTVYYRIDSATSYTLLGSCTVGHNVLPFGTLTADGIYPGLDFEEIELELRYTDSDAGNLSTPVVENMVFSFLKLKHASFSWSGTVDLHLPHHDQSPADLIAKLDALASQKTFFAMNHRGVTYRVRLNQPAGNDMLANDERGTRVLNLLEVPLQLGLT